jgi:hypothetical protein
MTEQRELDARRDAEEPGTEGSTRKRVKWDCVEDLGSALQLTKNGQGTKTEASRGRS